MDPLHILLVLLVIAGIWALIELALTIRRARTTVDSLDKTMGEVNDMLAETRPVVAKLDGAIDSCSLRSRRSSRCSSPRTLRSTR